MEILLMLSANRRYLCLYLIKYDGSVVYKNQQPLTQGSHLENSWNFVDMKNSCNFCIFDLEFFLHSFARFDIVKAVVHKNYLCYEDIFSEVVLLNMALAFSYRHMENKYHAYLQLILYNKYHISSFSPLRVVAFIYFWFNYCSLEVWCSAANYDRKHLENSKIGLVYYWNLSSKRVGTPYQCIRKSSKSVNM